MNLTHEIKQFDVLIVYSDGIAMSASSAQTNQEAPFTTESRCSHYNAAYSYFLQECARNGLSAAFTTSADILSNGVFRSYWEFRDFQWKKVVRRCTSNLIFDKFAPISKKQRDRRIKLFSNPDIQPFNDPFLFSSFFDKQATHNVLPTETIPTVSITKKKVTEVASVIQQLNSLIANHPHKLDFSRDFVMKDRYGAGGNNIYMISSTNTAKQIVSILEKKTNIQFVLQPFIKFKHGFQYKSFSGFTDTRIIFLNGSPIQTYIRVAQKNDFRCNEHLGGTLEYISFDDLPKQILTKAVNISNQLDSNDSLYALDFIVSDNGNIYLIEGNTGPGLDWNLRLKKNENHAKYLIRSIVETLVQKIEKNSKQIPTVNISTYHTPITQTNKLSLQV